MEKQLMRGIVNFYINYDPEKEDTFLKYIELLKKTSSKMMERISETGYEIAFIPVVGESSRVTKMELDSPVHTEETFETFETHETFNLT